MRRTKEQKGITLIALIITIIILIILAAVVIGVIRNTEIICLSKKSKYDYNEKKAEEETTLNDYQHLLDLKSMYTLSDAQTKGVLSKTKVTYVIDTYNNVISLPAGFKITKDGNTVPEGIVIEDCTNAATSGSQFVWIPVGTVYKNTNKAKVKIDLARYSFKTDGTIDNNFSNELYNVGETIRISNSYYFERLKNDTSSNVRAIDIQGFVDSVETNEGYYIGRFEARTTVSRHEWYDSTASTQVTVKPSDYIYRHISQAEASNLSRGMYKDNTETKVTSDLINSYAWDTAIVFIQKMGNEGYSMQKSKNTTVAVNGTNRLMDTSKQDKVCNIWDMSSNYLEWNTESGPACIMRGSYYLNNTRYTSERFASTSYTSKDAQCAWCTFRPIIYF